MAYSFVLTGGGTGGHVFPALAVAAVLRERGHRLLFVGTREGMEARLVPEAGYEIEFIRSSGLNRVGLRQQVRSTLQLPTSVAGCSALLRRFGARAVFSMGGYVAGPVMLGALLRRIPLIIMEPNAIPGFANRRVARRVYRALLGFESTRRWFPKDKCEVTGLPVRPEFFSVPVKSEGKFAVLITGGSRGSRTLNRASRDSWELFRHTAGGIRIVHQSGASEYAALSKDFVASGLEGEVIPFISSMAAAFAAADLVVGRSGAGAVNEIAAAGMPSVLVPFPFAADDHQKKNAEMLSHAGAARMVLDAEMNGGRLFREVELLCKAPEQRARMRERVRQFAHPGAAQRAADLMEEAARPSRDRKEAVAPD